MDKERIGFINQFYDYSKVNGDYFTVKWTNIAAVGLVFWYKLVKVVKYIKK